MVSADPRAAARQAAQVDFQLARAWRHKGRLDQAVLRFKAALDKDPGFGQAYLRLIRIYIQQRRWRDAATASIEAQRLFPEESEFHKSLVTALLEIGDIEDAFSHYRFERMDSRPLEIGAGEILACVVVRNEVQRLPYFLQYYRELGVDRFLCVDNASSDGTQALLLDQADVHLWVSDMSFKGANFGSAWFELLLRRYGQGHWCLTLDADELLVFPGCEARSLADYCRQLESAGKAAASGILLDMYSESAGKAAASGILLDMYSESAGKAAAKRRPAGSCWTCTAIAPSPKPTIAPDRISWRSVATSTGSISTTRCRKPVPTAT